MNKLDIHRTPRHLTTTEHIFFASVHEYSPGLTVWEATKQVLIHFVERRYWPRGAPGGWEGKKSQKSLPVFLHRGISHKLHFRGKPALNSLPLHWTAWGHCVPAIWASQPLWRSSWDPGKQIEHRKTKEKNQQMQNLVLWKDYKMTNTWIDWERKEDSND